MGSAPHRVRCAAAQLMELRKSEALRMLDHHDGCLGHVDTHLDDRGGHQQSGLPVRKARHCEILLCALHAAVNEIHHGAEALTQCVETLLRRREIDVLGFFHQRAHPIGAVPGAQCPADCFDHFLGSIERDGAGVDRLAPGRLLAQLRDIHVAEIGQHQGGGWELRSSPGHRRPRLCGQAQAAGGSSKPVLLIDNCKSKVAKLDLLLEQRMRPDQNVDLAQRELLENGAALATAFTPRQNGDVDPGESGERRDRVEVPGAPEPRSAPSTQPGARLRSRQRPRAALPLSCLLRRRPGAVAACVAAWPDRRRCLPPHGSVRGSASTAAPRSSFFLRWPLLTVARPAGRRTCSRTSASASWPARNSS